MQDKEPSSTLIRELYARFGLAYYSSECLHKELCNTLAIVTFQKTEDVTKPRLEEKLSYAYSLSLGSVVEALRKYLSEDFSEDFYIELNQIVDKRNFLAHFFWFERAHLMFTKSGILKMIEELDAYYLDFHKLDKKVDTYFGFKKKVWGLTEELLQSALDECIAGKPMDPLPEKRKLKKQERLVKVWEWSDLDGPKALFFETDDGCLWQLCDVGLGWTDFESIQPEWQLHPIINKYLPANINPRPKVTKSWNYEFLLAHGMALWVRRGERPRSFMYGIKAKDEHSPP